MSELTPELIKLLEQNKIIPAGCPPEQIKFFAKVCEIKKLDPFTRQIHLVERKSKDNGNWVKSYTIQAGIDGMRAIAQRNAKIKSYKRWVEKREDDLYGICEIETEDRGTYKDELPFNEYVQRKSDGSINSFWVKFPQTMIKKCAEESVLRMMTPEDLSGVYGDDEMLQADEEHKEQKLLSTPEVTQELPKIDYYEQTKDFKTMDEVKAWWSELAEDQKKAAYKAKESAKARIVENDIEDLIGKLKTNTYEKNALTIETCIDHQKDPERKQHLINLFNERLEKIGVDYRYTPLPFEGEKQ